MAEADTPLPDEYTFRLSRTGPVVTLAVLTLMVAGIVFLVGRDFPIGGTVWADVVRVIAAVFWMVIGVPQASALCAPLPRSVRLDAVGSHLEWADRREDWSWESLTCLRDKVKTSFLALEGECKGLPSSFVAWREKKIFWGIVWRHLAEPLGRHEAQRLAAGESVSPAPAHRRILASLTLAFWGYLALKSGLLLSMASHSWQRLPPQMAFRFECMWVLMVVVFLPLVVYAIRRDLRRIWFSIRFLPDGIEEEWPGGRRFISYDSIDRVTYHRKGWYGHLLIVRAGKQTLRLGAGMQLFWGARELLKQCVVWEEIGS